MKSTGRINQNGVYWFDTTNNMGPEILGGYRDCGIDTRWCPVFFAKLGLTYLQEITLGFIVDIYWMGVKGGYINQLITNGHLCGEKIYWLELVYGGSLWLILAISTYQALQWNGIQVLFIVVIPASSRSPFCGYNGYINPYWSRDDHRPKTGSLLYNVTSWKSRRSS